MLTVLAITRMTTSSGPGVGVGTSPSSTTSGPPNLRQIAAFIGTGTSFLAFAVMAERRGIASIAYPTKGFFYLGGLTEGTETIACFALMCLVPRYFAWWAGGFALLCALTIATRLVEGWRMLRDGP